MTTLNLKTFTEEVRQAGLIGLPFAWGEDGQISGRENLTAEQNATLDAVIAAHDPTRRQPHYVSKITIIRRLQAAGKFDAALTALKANALLYELWLAVSAIRSDDTQARALFAAVGADPDAMMAPDQ